MGQLDELPQEPRAVALVAAPAGFGKTLLVAAWCRARSLPSAWLSLDAADNDPQRFLLYLLAAVQTVLPPHVALDEIHLLARSPQSPPLPTLVNLLVNLLEETLAAPTILVLDDYHLINDASIHQSVQRLIEYHPPFLRLIITTRVDPPLPLARWRRGGCSCRCVKTN